MQQRTWSEAFAGIALACATCSLGWHRGHAASFPDFDHRMAEICRMHAENRHGEIPAPEVGDDEQPWLEGNCLR